MKHICHSECECHPETWHLGFIRFRKVQSGFPFIARIHTHRLRPLKGKVDHGFVINIFGYAVATTPFRRQEQ